MADPLARDRRRRPRGPSGQRPPARRSRGDAGLARQPGELRDPRLDRAPARAVAADVRLHRHRSRRGHDLGRDPRPGPAVPDRAGASRRARLPEDDRQARHPDLDPGRAALPVRRDERLGRARLAGRRVDRPGAHLLGVGQGRAQGPGPARLHPEREHQDARRALRRPTRPGCPGVGPDRLGRAGRPGPAPGPLDDPLDRRARGRARRPVRGGADRRPGAAGGLRPQRRRARSRPPTGSSRRTRRRGARRCSERRRSGRLARSIGRDPGPWYGLPSRRVRAHPARAWPPTMTAAD